LFIKFKEVKQLIMKYLLILFIAVCGFLGYSQTNDCNCCTDKHSEFDFWIGEWDVRNPDGTAAGNNRIEKVQNNCILQENWTSVQANYTGTSNNFYNYKTKQWDQIWIDNQGQSLHLKGNKVGNQMILQSDAEKDKDGNMFINRVTWTKNEDGSVRQLWETITNGTEISIAFDGLYKKTE
jgi:hypothetical protein